MRTVKVGSARWRTQPGTPYMAPQVLVNVDHTMSVMVDESFGPVIGIMKARRLRTRGIIATALTADVVQRRAGAVCMRCWPRRSRMMRTRSS